MSLSGPERYVLQVVLEEQGDSGKSVPESRIETTTALTQEQVSNIRVRLHKKECVSLIPTKKGLVAFIESKGRIERGLLSTIFSQPTSPTASEAKRVAVLGLTGTGKSLLINKIVQSDLMNVVSIFPGTTELQSLVVEINNQKIQLIDCPGIGSGIKSDKNVLRLYNKVINQCDCILWAIRADTSPISLDEQCIDQLSAVLIERELQFFLIVTHSDQQRSSR